MTAWTTSRRAHGSSGSRRCSSRSRPSPTRTRADVATELVQALLDLYGEALRADGGAGRATPQALADDELVSHLLMLHGIHPVPLEARVRGALDEVRPYLASHGGNVELVSVDDGVVLLRMEGSCSGCPSSTMTLKLAIEDAIHKAAPDVVSIEAEGAAPAPAPSPGADPAGARWSRPANGADRERRVGDRRAAARADRTAGRC